MPRIAIDLKLTTDITAPARLVLFDSVSIRGMVDQNRPNPVREEDAELLDPIRFARIGKDLHRLWV